MSSTIVEYEEAHFWLKKNKHLKTGYRLNHNTIPKILKSLTTPHNDLLNIWTHLLPVLFFFIYTSYFYLTTKKENISLIPMYLYFFASLFLFTCSNTYHLMRAHSLDRYVLFRKMDYLSIAVTIYFMSTSIYYYVFYFSSNLIICYTFIQTVGFFGMFFFILNPALKKHFRLAQILFVVIGVSNLLPFIHAIILATLANDGNGYLDIYYELFLIFLEGITFLIGFLFFSTHFPECKYPKTFDIWFNSHTIWHIFINISMWIHFIGLHSIYEKRNNLYN